VEVRKLEDAKALESLGQAHQPDALVSDFHIKPAIEKAIGAGNKGYSAEGICSLFKEPPPAGGGQLGSVRLYQPLKSPADPTPDTVSDP
jgi:hypothetical protein